MTVEANGVTLGSSISATRPRRSFCSPAARPCSPGPMSSARRSPAAGAMSSGTTCATPARRPPSIPGLRRTVCEILPATLRRLPANSMPGQRIWRASASAGWSPRSPRSITRARSRRSPSQGRGPSLRAPSTTTCLITTRRRWTGCSRARCPTGPIAVRWWSTPPRARDPRRRPGRGAHDRRAHLDAHAGHGPRGADGQSARHGVRQARLQAALARAPVRARDADAGGARSPRPVLSHRQRRSARARDPGARLLMLERAATAIPDAAAGEVAAAMLAL